jgi:hypothetical protein
MWPQKNYKISFGKLEKKFQLKRILGHNILFLYFIFLFWHNFASKKKNDSICMFFSIMLNRV